MRFSVIMPVFLGEYTSRGSNPDYKFERAVKTYQEQEFKDSELIIISDGCDIAERIYNEQFSEDKGILFKKIEKQPPFGGRVRQTGIEMAQGEIICYLDADDIFGKKHLQIINDNFDTSRYDWVFYNDYLIVSTWFDVTERNISPVPCQIGTSCIAHKRNIEAVWGDRYGHDWAFISDYLYPHRLGAKIITPQYYVCHTPGGIDF